MNRSYRGKNGDSHTYRSGAEKPRKARGGSRITGLIVVLTLLVFAGAGIVYLMNQGNEPTAGQATATPQSSVQPANGKFAEGVYVDGIPLGGLTRGQAEQQLKSKHNTYVADNGVTVTDGTNQTLFKISDTDYTYDTESVLDQAFEAGRDGTDLTQNPVKLTTKITVDPSKLEQKVRDLAAPCFKPAVDAAYTGIDPATHKPLFTPDQPGQQVDTDALWNNVKQAFTSGTLGTVQLQPEPLPANVTLASLQANMQLITTNPVGDNATTDAANVGHTFTTRIKNHTKERLANITLVGDGVTGHGLLQPGQTLSVNDATGPRTAAKGYKIAPVDINGISDIGLGGGACQVSGTLYNAAIRYGGKFKLEDTTSPGLDIVERNVHSMPSAYMKMGTDATVDYGSKDLKIRNDFTTPVLIVLYYEKDAKGRYWEHCDIYGPPLPSGVTYNLVTKLVATIPPKEGTRKQATSGVPQGTTKTIAAHPGYKVDVFIEKVAADGTKTDTKIYQDKYDADCTVIAYFKLDAVPTDEPSPSPTDDITPPPSTNEPTPTPTKEPTPTPSPTPTPTPTPTPPPTDGGDGTPVG